MKRLAGKRALVTGASSGIGREIALRLAMEGCAVGIHYLDQKAEAQALEAHIRSENGLAYIFQADLTDLDAVTALADHAWETMSGVDFLINNAGVSYKKHFLETTREDVDIFINTNYRGTFFLTQAIARNMVKHSIEGAIYSITSVNGIRPGIGQSAYGASKSALETLMKGVALELAPHNIKVNTIAAGAIATDMTREARSNPATLKEVTEGIPMGRFGLAEEVASVVVSLLISGSYLTGESITIDGGLLLMRGYGKPGPYDPENLH
ncbi:SDR family NAD(P)-dependent oxidoreductase [Dyadobacter aurulentus]|uniref:SDR family NAD(P)-dependent oxidoreductase n=1 Tax=Dyadobacter sp. UC 10 TaxID=2605428 RepID=UPI0011F1B7E9|nr:SDR family oxidoreductase [Dyadobacter sp. UC 10]KAA0992715.1 SDR family oxidoreductase [Dyadobacter sp. UC 10]